MILREEHSLRVFENRVFRRIYGFKRYEIIGGSRKIHSEELQSSYRISSSMGL
jgi:hypothetical protein